jgi:hypothetical protein
MSHSYRNLTDLLRPDVHYSHCESEDAIAEEEERIIAARLAAGWTQDSGGWFSICGISAADWEREGLPFPEDLSYPAWASAFYHYDAEDNGQLSELDATIHELVHLLLPDEPIPHLPHYAAQHSAHR